MARVVHRYDEMLTVLAHAGFTGHDDTDVLEGRFIFGLESVLSGVAEVDDSVVQVGAAEPPYNQNARPPDDRRDDGE